MVRTIVCNSKNYKKHEKNCYVKDSYSSPILRDSPRESAQVSLNQQTLKQRVNMVVMRMIAQNSDQDQRSALQPSTEARPQVNLQPLLGRSIASLLREHYASDKRSSSVMEVRPQIKKEAGLIYTPSPKPLAREPTVLSNTL